MINKQLNQITVEDLNNLIQNAIPERKTIEYKRSLPENSDSAKKEFLADISSFANASGGDMIFGLEENNGVPTSLSGLTIDDTDAEILKLENIIRDGIEPRVTAAVQTINLPNDKVIFIFRTNKSWLGPHRVIYKGHDKFYSRNSAGKYPLDTIELRTAFNLSQTLVDKMLKFRVDRITKLYANETPIPSFPEGPKVVLHIIPFESFSSNINLDLSTIMQDARKLPPMFSHNWTPKINFEGVVTYSNSEKSYVQMYRNGIVEAVDNGMLDPVQPGRHEIPGQGYEKRVIASLRTYLQTLRDFGINPPFAIFLTLTGIKGYKMGISVRPALDYGHVVDRDILQLPEKIIESFNIRSEDILRSLFDLVWNCCGFEKSPNFDEQGNFIST